jgi:hypothetical protein
VDTARWLEGKGDEGAIAEYALAIHYDPTNQDALRSYAGYLLLRKDYRGAVPVLRRLVPLSRKESDAKNLIKALIGIGDAHSALSAHRSLIGDQVTGTEYLDALILTGDYPAAAAGALEIYHRTGDPAPLQKYLAALAQYDIPASLEAYEANGVESMADPAILADYALLLSASGLGAKALAVCDRLLRHSNEPAYRLLVNNIRALHDRPGIAIAGFEQLITDELKSKNDLDLLSRIIGNYRILLLKSMQHEQAEKRFLAVVSKDINVASLLETARFYEDLKNPAEARSWYYRAYRADFINGGMEYAQFLAAAGEIRECEKVMLYILSNIKRSQDLHRVAAAIVDTARPMHRMRRLMDNLIHRLDERKMNLNSDGLELLAVAFLIAAQQALEDGEYADCKRFCLKGLDVLPSHTNAIRPDDFLSLINTCKERAIADRPVIDQPFVKKSGQKIPAVQQIRDELDLDEQEQKIVEFLRSHKKATELDLRKALSSRRVAGIINRLIQKAAIKNISVIVKKGVGEEGEVYEYDGN